MSSSKSIKEKLGFGNFGSYDFLFFCIWSLNIIMYYFRVFTSRLLGVNTLDNPIIAIFIVVGIIVSYSYIRKNIKPIDIILYCAIGGVYYSHIVLYPQNAPYLNDLALDYFITILPLYFLFLCFNVDKSLPMLRTIAIASIIIDFVVLFLFGGAAKYGFGDEEYHGMTMAYGILPHVLIEIWMSFRYRRMWDIIFSCIGFLLLLSMGTRGPILCLAVFVIGYLLFFGEFRHRARSRVIIGIVGVIALWLIEPLVKMLNIVIVSMGMSTRITSMIINNSLDDMNGRDIIGDFVRDAINQGPFWGYGLAGDRAILSGTYLQGGFSHNILTELQASFGLIPGIIIFGGILFFIFIVFRHSTSLNNKVFFLLLVSMSCSLWVSGSFLMDNVIYMMFGFGVNILRRNSAANRQYYTIESNK